MSDDADEESKDFLGGIPSNKTSVTAGEDSLPQSSTNGTLDKLRAELELEEIEARKNNIRQLASKFFWLEKLLGGSILVLFIVWFFQACIYLSLLYFPDNLKDATVGDETSLLFVPILIFVNAMPLFVFGIAFVSRKPSAVAESAMNSSARSWTEAIGDPHR